MNSPDGCRFHTRCLRRDLMPDGGKRCATEAPMYQDVGDGHLILCHLPLEVLRHLEPGVMQADG
ncbi:hypothetical protein [Caldilinea sp.]|uniref:hypothetical protein n=1 Tax=Caldilinea sp. TaxID=2293560 RepID=UPI002C9C8030|nr:hypothetical protein [Caldilinea sp.]